MPILPPSQVLSESFQAHLDGRRVKTAVFFSFSFDPAFFEQQILPVFLDVPLSQASQVRLVQLEDEIKGRLDHVAVYYDPRGLVASNDTPRLDVRRIPVALHNGFFHPKNIFLLTESTDVEPDVAPTQTLVVATLSANLTEAGWWRNVECCHTEVVEQGDSIGFRDDLLELFRTTRAASPASVSHDALEQVRRFVVGCEQRRRVSGGRLPTRLLGGRIDFVNFVADAAKGRLDGLNLEVIAPYVDDTDAAPLRALVERFSPVETRVLLPLDKSGAPLCSEAYYEAVRKTDSACWALLPKSILQAGRTEQAVERFVHAKVYRFFNPKRRYEALIVGSVNLTGAAHSKGGNVESAFIVEPALTQVPDWWLSRADGKKPTVFKDSDESGEVVSRGPGIWLSVTYHWGRHTAEAEWLGAKASSSMELYAAGIHRVHLDAMNPGQRRQLGEADAKAIRVGLETTSLLTVRVEGAEDGPLLVREEGMAWKPSILLTLSVADILRYWSALTREQQMALLDDAASRDPVLAGALTVVKRNHVGPRDSFFDNFAQIFQAFENVEQSVTQALELRRESEAVQRLLGEKYDSLPHLLKRVLQPESQADPVSRYLIALCARQTLQQVRKSAPEFARVHRARFDELALLTDTSVLKQQMNLGAVEQPEAFLEWFEKWFVARAEPSKELV